MSIFKKEMTGKLKKLSSNILFKKCLTIITPIFFLMNHSFVSASIWHFNVKAKPTEIVVDYPTQETRSDLTVELHPHSLIKGAKVDPIFYGAGVATFLRMPDNDIARKLPLSIARLGGNEFSRYDFESTLIRNRIYGVSEDPAEAAKVKITYSSLPDLPQMVEDSRVRKMEPIVQVNLVNFKPTYNAEGRPTTITVDPAQEAYKLLKYLNETSKLGVRYFSLDNEPLQWPAAHFDLIQDLLSADEYIDLYVRTVISLRTAAKEVHGDPNAIKIFGPEESRSWDWFMTGSPKDCTWVHGRGMVCEYGRGTGILFENFLDYFLYRIGKIEKDPLLNPMGYKLLDIFSFHAYPLFRTNYPDASSFVADSNGQQDVTGYLQSIRLWDTDIINTIDYIFPRNRSINFFSFLNRSLEKYYPDAETAITEFGVDASGQSIDYHPLVRPLYVAEMAAIAALHGVKIFALSYLNANEFNINSWPLVSSGRKLIPTFHTYSLMSRYFKGKFFKTVVQQSSLPTPNKDLVAYSVASKEGYTTILINKNSTKAMQVSLKKFDASGKSAHLTVITVPELSFVMIRMPKSTEDRGQLKIDRYGQLELGVQNLELMNR